MSDQVDLPAVLDALTRAIEAMNAQTAATIEVAAQIAQLNGSNSGQSDRPNVVLKPGTILNYTDPLPPKLMTVPEFCKAARVGHTTLSKDIKNGLITPIRMGSAGGRMFFQVQQIAEYHEACKRRPGMRFNQRKRGR